jgi:hypothetical protein
VRAPWRTIRHRENITLSMITGRKEASPGDAIRSSRPLAALAFVAIIGFLAIGLFRNYDQAKSQIRLPYVNTVIHLGEGERD